MSPPDANAISRPSGEIAGSANEARAAALGRVCATVTAGSSAMRGNAAREAIAWRQRLRVAFIVYLDVEVVILMRAKPRRTCFFTERSTHSPARR